MPARGGPSPSRGPFETSWEGEPPCEPSADAGSGGPSPSPQRCRPALETEEEESPGDVLMRLAGVERVILGSDGRPYAVVSENGRVECCELRSKAFRHRLVRASLMATRKLPGPEAISAVVGALEAKGEFDGELADVFLRVARGGSRSSYFLDLAGREGRVIEIRADGWEPVARSPVFFRRARGQLALPMPARDGSVELLKKYVNVDERDWPLFTGWLTAGCGRSVRTRSWSSRASKDRPKPPCSKCAGG